jgi:2-polyprenyl-3-methyl-5-hydroxy-6-metoxy-1,4-benzoquinol methylase
VITILSTNGMFVLRILPLHTHIWKQFISPKNVGKILKSFGCETVLVRGTEYQFYLCPNRFKYYSNQKVTYMLHAIKNDEKGKNVVQKQRSESQKIAEKFAKLNE